MGQLGFCARICSRACTFQGVGHSHGGSPSSRRRTAALVRAYGVERTLCDVLRGMSSPDLQLLSPAFRSYSSPEGRNLPKLQSFADKLGVAAKVRRCMEALL